MTTVILDTGALIGFERIDRRVVAIIASVLEHHDSLIVPSGVLVLDDRQARAAGQLCGLADTTDVIAASVAVAARDLGARVLTSDPDDLRRLDRRLELIAI